MNTEEVRREAMDIQETMGEQMTGCFASSKDHLYVKSSDGEPCDGETPVQGVEVRCYTAGAGNAREAFAAMGFKMVAVIDQTSSAITRQSPKHYAMRKVEIDRMHRPTLRSTPQELTIEQLHQECTLDEDMKPLKSVTHQYRVQDEMVVDEATGLMWQKSGSDTSLTYKEAQSYIMQLNAQQFAGYSDWRVPTIQELMSLLEPTEKNDDLYIEQVFDKTQRYCWSADRMEESEHSFCPAWYVNFNYGYVYCYPVGSNLYVRAVRSI